MTDTAQRLLVVDALGGLTRVEPIAPLPLPPKPLTADAIYERLRRWSEDFARGQAEATVKAVRADWAQYLKWCDGAGVAPLPASCDQLGDFVLNAVERGRKRTTLKRYVYTVGLIHAAAGLPNPSEDPRWKPKWAAIGKALAARVDARGQPDNGNVITQAGELLGADVQTIVASLGTSLHDLRDAAMLMLASDSLLRESELVRVRVEHLEYNRTTERWSLFVPFTKTNATGAEKKYRYVDPATVERIRAWQAASGITEGLLFRPIGGRRRAAHRAMPRPALGAPAQNTQHAATELAPIVALRPREVARIFRRRAIAAGLPHAWSISGHSARVGTANDLINSGATTAEIQDAGDWKTAEMVSVYTRRSQAGSNAVARLRRGARGSGQS
jgi:integrase